MSALSLQLPRALSVEVRKYRKTLAFWLVVVAPLFLVILTFCMYWLREAPMVAPEGNAWHAYGESNITPSVYLLFPMFVTLLSVFFFQTEHQSNSWKHLWVLPVSRGTQYLAKVLMLLGLIAASLALFCLYIWASGWLLSVLRPELGFQEDVGMGKVVRQIAIAGVGSLALIAFQFWFSFRWRSLLLPLALGIGGLISANIMMAWEHAVWHPYTAPILSMVTDNNEQVVHAVHPLWYSVIVGLGVFVLAFFEGKRRVLA